MNIGEKLYGFAVTEERYVEELSATVYTLVYESCGARLTYVLRDDDNKTFSITFKTLPEDSTGVFHILEHSVLCGSEKYPVKDPFVELLKGSLNTFLNAMTFQDKTMYPVSSRCDRDFLNLVDVYMDAVLNPLAVKNKSAFMQEGWHYEIKEDGTLAYNGVVLNEMRGDYSTPESVATRHINAMLYEGTPYAHDSGGDPEKITKLTYEDFVAAHKRYYHPTYAELFLDGGVDLDSVLPLLSSYLSKYTFSDTPKESFIIPRVTINAPKERTVYYEVKDGEDPKNKGRVSISFIGASFDEGARISALGAIGKALISTNESPVKRALLESGLCEDVTYGISDGILEPSVNLDFIGVKDGCSEELISLFYSEIERVCRQGIDREELCANLNLSEFIARERDYGTLPQGVANAMLSLETLLYSDDPIGSFSTGRVFGELREKLDTDYFESLLSEVILNNPKRATVILLPSTTLAAEREAEERAELARIRASLTDGELASISDDFIALSEWQSAEDSEEALATLPTLTLDDISKEPAYTPTEVKEICDVRVVEHRIPTNGIVYATLYFDISDVTCEELVYVDLYSKLLTNLPTKRRSAIELQRYLKSHIGGFDVGISPVADKSGEKTTVYFTVGISVLRGEAHLAPAVVKEILKETLFDDKKAIKNIIRQYVLAAEESFAGAGHRCALGRVAASGSVASAVREYTDGYEGYITYKRLDDSFELMFDEISASLRAVSNRLLDRGRTVISVSSGEDEGELTSALIDITEDRGSAAPVCNISPLPVLREGIAIPARVGFAARGYNVFKLGERPSGSLDVVRLLVGYEMLWPEIRVKGGAYGAGMSAGIAGTVSFYSYRDPAPVRSLKVYEDVPAFLDEIAESDVDLTKYIIGAVGDTNPIKTPRMRGSGATLRYLRGLTREDERALRREMLSTDRAELRRIAEIIRRSLDEGGVCVVAPREKLAEIEGLDRILEI